MFTTRLWALVLLVACMPLATLAEGYVTQGYLSKTDLPPGSVVSLTANSEVVTAANTSNISNLLGVVSTSPAISISSSNDATQVQSTGIADTLVSNINGNIKAGDRITASSLSGIGAKLQGNGRMLGVAQSNFSSASSDAKPQTLREGTGATRRIMIGQIPVALNVATYSDGGQPRSVVPQNLQLFANQVAGRQVSAISISLALAVLLLGFGISAALLSGSTRGGILSIGRNPLAKRSVFAGIGRVALLAISITGLCIAFAYVAIKYAP